MTPERVVRVPKEYPLRLGWADRSHCRTRHVPEGTGGQESGGSQVGRGRTPQDREGTSEEGLVR